MLAGGCLLAAIAGIVGLVYSCRDRERHRGVLASAHALPSLVAALLSVFTSFVHSREVAPLR